MITNKSLTVYHKGFDSFTRKETWTRFNYENVWIFGGRGAGINKGYDNGLADKAYAYIRSRYDIKNTAERYVEEYAKF